jgi:hypothetical protein
MSTNNVIVKSDSMDNHLVDLRLALERMHRYVSSSQFLGFIIHEHGIEIDPTEIESINKVQPPQCKHVMQKFLGKLNFLRWFIFNSPGKISASAPLLQLKNEAEFTWGVDQPHALDDIKRYSSSPPVMKAPMAGIPFRLDIAAEDVVIRTALTQVTEGKERIITYLSWYLIDAETRYSFIEMLYLSLFYTCSKLRYYLLSTTCIIACQADVIRHMLQKPILSGRIEMWAYVLIEYDLAYEPLKSIKGLVVDFIIGHSIDQNNDESCNLVSIHP